jgi:hypothetical protein
MSIHDFYSKLMSGNEEGSFIEALRRLSEAKSVAVLVARSEASIWSMWNEETTEDGGSLCAANA